MGKLDNRIQMEKSREILVVLGMHRSGTSALSGVLNLAGIDFGLENKLIGPNKNDNAKGYWENREIMELNDELLSIAESSWDDFRKINFNFLQGSNARRIIDKARNVLIDDFASSNVIGIKEPRMCRLLPIWKDIFRQLDLNVKYVIACRHPFEVCKSLELRDGIKSEKAYLLWITYMLDIEEYTFGERRVFVSYEELLLSWQDVLKKIQSELDLSINLVTENNNILKINEFLSTNLRHYVAGDEFEQETGIKLVKQINLIIKETLNLGQTSESHRVLEDIRRNYWASLDLTAPLIYEKGATSAEISQLREKITNLSNAYIQLQTVHDNSMGQKFKSIIKKIVPKRQYDKFKALFLKIFNRTNGE